jgi:hypothetical protein
MQNSPKCKWAMITTLKKNDFFKAQEKCLNFKAKTLPRPITAAYILLLSGNKRIRVTINVSNFHKSAFLCFWATLMQQNFFAVIYKTATVFATGRRTCHYRASLLLLQGTCNEGRHQLA